MMNYDYDYKITYKSNDHFDINYINDTCNQYPNSRFLVEVQNTKGISSSMLRKLKPNTLIRIAGGFDEERCRDGYFVDNNYFESVIYTRNEAIKLLEQIERIESGMDDDWTDLQKLIYIYDRLKSEIMYYPKYKEVSSFDICSLRGLFTKQTKCSGYSLILKEFMDRNNVICEYVEGFTKENYNGGHAWNIVSIDGKKYPIDLTWDNSLYRTGKSISFDWLGTDIKKFCKNHIPLSTEKTQNYLNTLTPIDPKIVKQIYALMGIGKSREYLSTTYQGTRKDGSKFIIYQIGDNLIKGNNYYRYYYVGLSNDGKKSSPLILYSEFNIINLINRKLFGKSTLPNLEDSINNVLFSKENINDSIDKKTFYIGTIEKKGIGNKSKLLTSYKDIDKPKKTIKLFAHPTKTFTRSDGSVFIAQQMFINPHKIKNIDFLKYDIFEMIVENGKEILKKNSIFTEKNFFYDKRQSMVDDYLSRERLDRKYIEAGGYIGYYDENGIRTFNPDLVKVFKSNKKVDIDSMKKRNQKKVIPKFDELKDLVLKYKVLIDSNDSFYQINPKIKIKNIKTGEIETDKTLKDKVMFAYIWLSSAGVKHYKDESIPGFKYAFNKNSEELYRIICRELTNYCKNKGVIDTIDLLRNIDNHDRYKYNKEIIVNLFQSKYQTELINRLFLHSIGIEKQISSPKPLYSMNYAGEYAFNDNSNTKKR